MAERVSLVIKKLISERKIIRSRIPREMVLNELKGADSDLREARESFEAGKYKLATIQAYYLSFHSARALLCSRGFREKSHRGLLQALRELFRPQLTHSLLDDFQDAMSMREAADYGLIFSEEGARDVLDTAEAFLSKTRLILRAEQT